MLSLRYPRFSPQCPFWTIFRDRGCFIKASPNVGLEPTTLRLRVWCSTDWASRAVAMLILNGLCFADYVMQRFLLEYEASSSKYSGISWLNGLVVWFSLWVREAPGSNPGWAQLIIFILTSSIFLLDHISTCFTPFCVKKLGSTEIWTRIAGFKVQSANHYTIEPVRRGWDSNPRGQSPMD